MVPFGALHIKKDVNTVEKDQRSALKISGLESVAHEKRLSCISLERKKKKKIPVCKRSP